jgi:hypothetical protein
MDKVSSRHTEKDQEMPVDLRVGTLVGADRDAELTAKSTRAIFVHACWSESCDGMDGVHPGSLEENGCSCRRHVQRCAAYVSLRRHLGRPQGSP